MYDLRQAFLVGVLLPLAALSAAVVMAVTDWAERSLESRLHGEIELISRAVAPEIGRKLVEPIEGDAIRRSLESLFEIGRVYGAAVYDERGDLVVAAGTTDQDLRTSRTASNVVETGEEDGNYRDVDGRSVYAYFTPLLDPAGRIHGLLQITRDRREIDASLAQLRTVAWSVWLLAILLAVAVAIVLYRRLVGRPVSALLERMGALAGGDRSVSYRVGAPREFAELAVGFNRMVESIRDAESELRRKQRRERGLERRLRESEKAAVIGRVSQGLAHELGSPLSVLDGRVRRMERDTDESRARRTLGEIRRQVERMSGIVRQLLEYGRLELGGHVEVELSPLLHRLAKELPHDEQRVVVRDVPDVAVHGDPVRLELAISNLMANAVRHARREVVVGARLAGGGVCVYVRDDGPGVDPGDRLDVFQPFFTRQAAGEGSGLGLAIASNVMREHDGRIDYEEPAGGGAQFVLRFPPERTRGAPS